MHRLTLLTASALLLAAVGCAGQATNESAVSPSFHTAAIRSFSKAYGDYLPAHNFKLEIDGVLVGGFEQAYKDGDDMLTHKRPGKPKYQNIVLKRGFVADPALLEWTKAALDGKVERKSGSIIYLDREGNDVLRTSEWFECWPVRMASKDVGYGVTLVDGLVLEVDPESIKVRHDAAMNAIGNIR
jgi:phage tail-like protein